MPYMRTLPRSRVPLYILEVFMAAMLYADDMALLAPSVNGLQLLLDKYSIIISNGTSLSIRNNLKSCILKKNMRQSWNYLGVQVVRGNRFGCTVIDRIKKFYQCANAIFRIEGRSDDITMLRLGGVIFSQFLLTEWKLFVSLMVKSEVK